MVDFVHAAGRRLLGVSDRIEHDVEAVSSAGSGPSIGAAGDRALGMLQSRQFFFNEFGKGLPDEFAQHLFDDGPHHRLYAARRRRRAGPGRNQ